MDTTRVRFRHTRQEGSFWKVYLDLMRTKVLPYQWRVLHDQVPGAEPSHAIENFRIAAGLTEGAFHGFVFQDSDVGKWIEAAAWSLAHHPDPGLEAQVDQIVTLLGQAQAPDGYLNTYFTVAEPGRRWTNLGECHELYTAGHLLEGAVAYYEVTGKRAFLDLMLKFVGLIGRTFGPGEGQVRGYDGHEEVETALVALYETLGDPAHLDLASFFLDERGQEPSFFRQQWEALGRISHWTRAVADPPGAEYTQTHRPVRAQTAAVGHAVRALYLYAGMAGVALHRGDRGLAAQARILWQNVLSRQVYVTGAVGSTPAGEAFTTDYDLPNDTAYAETCASVALVLFAQRMLGLEPRAEYADGADQALYNTVLAGVSLDGEHFFYSNPQEVWPPANLHNPGRRHAKTRRQAWFACACCPPNLARLVLSLDRHAAAVVGSTVHLHHFLAGSLEAPVAEGLWAAEIATEYPHDGRIEVRVTQASGPARGAEVAVRIPGWCPGFRVTRNGAEAPAVRGDDGYVRLAGPWAVGDEVVVDLEFEVQVVEAHPQVRADAGKVCLRRGPVVFCFEEADNGPNLSALRLDLGREFRPVQVPGVGPGLAGWAQRRSEAAWGSDLYRPRRPGAEAEELVPVLAIPYHLWGQRSEGEMAVWMRV